MLQLKPDAEQVKEEILTKSTVIIRYRKAFIANFVTTTMNLCHLRCIYATFILGKALLNSGTRTNNIGHSMLDFCRVKANFSTCVPKNLSGPRPPREVVSARLKEVRLPKLEVILSPESLRSPLCHESEGSGVENELLVLLA